MSRTDSSSAGLVLGGAARVAGGIFSSRLFGLVRDLLVAFFFGVGPHADVYRAAFRGSNILQNLLGEQALSASFIPIYSKLLAEGRAREAGRFAGAVFALLVAAAGGLALLGILFAETIVTVLSPGYLEDGGAVAAGVASVDRFPLAVGAVRILFPMTAILVLSAWALGVLNSHRRFFVSYFAPVMWNLAIIVALLAAGQLLLPGGIAGAEGAPAPARSRLLIAVCWGALAGGLLQFLFQLPLVARLIRGFRFRLSLAVPGVRQAIARFLPLLAARGAAQLSAYFDLFLSSFLVAGAQAGLGQAQLLYLLPIALFSLSVAAAELPELSSLADDREAAAARARSALRAIAFWIVPTAVGYLAIGYLLVGALFRRGAFGIPANWLVYLVLAAYAVGLLATGWSRLLGNVFYALGETRRPASIAVVRVVVSAALGAALMGPLDRFPVSTLAGEEGPLHLGAVGLALAAGVSSWLELVLLSRSLRRRSPAVRLPLAYAAGRGIGALIALVPALVLWWLLRGAPVEVTGAAALIGYAATYLIAAWVTGVPEAEEALGTAGRLIGSGRGRRGQGR